VIDVLELSSIEVVGGASRIPCVQKVLEGFFGKELSKTCDSDESVARGCALQCAMLSPNYQVRPYEVNDINLYPIDLHWGIAPEGGESIPFESSTQLFTHLSPIPSTKMISFKNRDRNFQLVAQYSSSNSIGSPPGLNPVVGTFIVKVPPTPAPAPGCAEPKIKVRVKVTPSNLVEVVKAELIQEVPGEAIVTPAATGKWQHFVLFAHLVVLVYYISSRCCPSY